MNTLAITMAQVGTSALPLDIEVDRTLAWFDIVVSVAGIVLIVAGVVIAAIRGEFTRSQKKTPADPVAMSPRKARIGSVILLVGSALTVTAVLPRDGPTANERWRTHTEAARQNIERFDIDAASYELHAAMAALDEVGAEDPRRAATLTQLAAIDQNNGAFADAAAKLERVERILAGSAAAKPKHRLLVAAMLASSHLAVSDLSRVSEVVERATALAESSGMMESAQFALILSLDGGAKLSRLELDAAEQALRRSVLIAEADPEGIAGVVGRCRAGLALWHQLSGDLGTAIDVYRQSIVEMEGDLPPQNLELQGAWIGLRDALAELGRMEEAAEAQTHITTFGG